MASTGAAPTNAGDAIALPALLAQSSPTRSLCYWLDRPSLAQREQRSAEWLLDQQVMQASRQFAALGNFRRAALACRQWPTVNRMRAGVGPAIDLNPVAAARTICRIGVL